MGRLVVAALVAAGITAGAGGAAVLNNWNDGDSSIAPIDVRAGVTNPGRDSPRVFVDDDVPNDRAEAVATAAAKHVRGRALTVDIDDGFYEVGVQRPDSAIVTVLLDGTNVLGVDTGDGDEF